MAITILVVDDEEDVRTLCTVNLEYEGYEVIEAGNGIEGLDAAARELPDLILLDLMMPKMDGWTMMEKLKEDKNTALIPVILLTAKADESLQLKGWGEGILDYITKPFNPLILSRYVEQALKDRDPEDVKRRRDMIVDQLKLRQDLRKPEEGENGT